MSEPGDPSDYGESPKRRWRVVASAAVVGFAAVMLGVPQFMAGLALNPYDSVMRDLALDRPVRADLAGRTAESRSAALRWLSDGTTLGELATLRLIELSGTRVFSPARRLLAEEAVALQAQALALAPGDGFGWTRYLQALAVSAAPAGDIERVLDFAMTRAPTDPALVLTRIRVATLYWRGLSEKLRNRMSAQFVLAALWSPTTLARIGRARQMEDVIAAQLSANPVALARFNYARSRLTGIGG